jgi:hypothetical protein
LQLRIPTFHVDPPSLETGPPPHITPERWESAERQHEPVLGWMEDGNMQVQFARFARYVFDPVRFQCAGSPFAGASDAQLTDTFQRAVLPLVLQSRGTEALHASAIDTEEGVFAFAALSGTGKSTLAAEFSVRGYSVWADDVVTWSVEGGKAVTASLPFVLRVGERARDYVPLASDSQGKHRPLKAVVVMARSQEPGPVLCRIERASVALTSILPHAYCFSTRDRLANRSLISNYLALLDAIPLYHLSFPDRPELLPAIVDLLSGTLALRPALEQTAHA